MGGGEVTLRAGNAGDVTAMFALDLLCFDERFRFDLSTMEDYALDAGAVVLVAESGSEPIGFVIVARDGGEAYVTTLDVLPGARRLGVAKRLMLAAEARLAEMGVGAVGLHVFVDNEAAIRFYGALGYRCSGRARNYYGRGVDAWVYGKVLKAGE